MLVLREGYIKYRPDKIGTFVSFLFLFNIIIKVSIIGVESSPQFWSLVFLVSEKETYFLTLD